MTLDNDLQNRFDSAHQAIDLDEGSSTEIKQLADRRTRRGQVVNSALASAAVIAAIVGIAWLGLRGTGDDPAESVVAAESVPTTTDAATGSMAVAGPVTEANFTYLGAFRLPDGDWTGSRFAYGGEAAAFYADGDPESDDGFDGSLFISGHPVRSPGVAEVAIPAPALHDGSSVDLPIAEVLESFTDITAGRGMTYVGGTDVGGGGQDGAFRYSGLEVIDTANGPRLAWTIWQYNNVANNIVPGHGHSGVDLDEAPDPEGPWFLGDYDSRATAGYLFTVDQTFANEHLGGNRLITGLQDRRPGGDTSYGPPFFAFTAPDTAEPGSQTDVLPLAFYDGEPQALEDFGRADTAGGAAWISTSDGAEAIVTVGVKGLGEVHNGEPRAEDCGTSKGRHAGPYEPQVLFYDPADLARAAAGELELWQLEPYHRWNPEEHLVETCDWRLTSASFDEASRRLYVVQTEADIEQNEHSPIPVVHVFQL